MTNEPEEKQPAEEVKAEVEQKPDAAEAKPEGDARPEGEAKAEQPQPTYQDPRELRIQMLERMLGEREATLHTYIRAHKKMEQEFDAFRQRMSRDKDREVSDAISKLVEKLLDVDENLERTVQAASTATASAQAYDGLVSGVKLTHKMFLERLGELGLQRIAPTGETFDPTSMEALGVMPVSDPSKDGKVAITLRAGFKLGDRLLRPALVQIGKLMS